MNPKVIVWLMISTLLLPSCFGQEKKQNRPSCLLPQSPVPVGLQHRPAAPAPANFRLAARKATSGVVYIQALNKGDSSQPFNRLQNSNTRSLETPSLQSSASGVLLSSDGYLVTNSHVVEGAQSVAVVLRDRRAYPATLIGRDPRTELALLKIEEKELSFLEWGHSDSLEVGDWVLAVGNPFNLASTVTAGIVSAKARHLHLLSDRGSIEEFIQTDAAVNKGNSGGALVDMNGRLVGIIAAFTSPTGVYAGYSFAIPVELVQKVTADLRTYGTVQWGHLGAYVADISGSKAKALGLRSTAGALVDSLLLPPPATGLQPGDIIVTIDHHPVESVTTLREVAARYRPGTTVSVGVIRRGRDTTVPVVLQSYEAYEQHTQRADTERLLQRLGMRIEELYLSEQQTFGLAGGIKITQIEAGSLVLESKIRTGFIILKVNQRLVATLEEFVRILADYKGPVLLEGFYPGDLDSYHFYGFSIDDQ